jgi:excisionase family DNA binding protein
LAKIDDVARAPISIEGATDVSTTKNQTTAGKRLFTIKELVDQLGATEWFWRSQIWAGRLPFVQVGRKMLIDREDIDAFIARHKTRHLA